MKPSEAIQLISNAEINDTTPQFWADLGCGSGIFTTALASRLPPDSVVHAVDRTAQHLPASIGNVSIRFYHADFETDDFYFSGLHGILLANSLHYVADTSRLIDLLNAWLHPTQGQYLLIEYDSRQRNRWVPYPLPFDEIEKLFTAHGFTRITKLAEKKSLYRKGNIYACQVRR